MMLARLLEVDRQAIHRFSAADRARLLRDYVSSVHRVGVACPANTCGNRSLLEAIRRDAPQLSGLAPAELARYHQTVARAISPIPPPGSRAGRPAPSPAPGPRRPPGPPPVTGFKMDERTLSPTAPPSPPGLPAQPYGYLLGAALPGAGMLSERLRVR